MNMTLNRHQVDSQLIFRRVTAYFIDITLLMIAVQGFQWGLSALTGGSPFKNMAALNNGWLIYGWLFLTISLPIWFYFALSEHSSRQATLGKRLMGLQVVSLTGEKASWGQLFGRIALKFLPWEIFHLTLMLPVPIMSDPNPTFRPGFIIGFALLMFYSLVMFQTDRQQSIHDLVTQTVVVKRP
ncbi:hypothetical protein MNBD_CHLOROFLEXI01-4120 [hydrothermal vent metagenome]|uniref:RDD domain-containing protein n=1 Tax=hydrothermal vent metagenome TaxID=652676 RepID=A0A3B0URG9_9ZZZZ